MQFQSGVHTDVLGNINNLVILSNKESNLNIEKITRGLWPTWDAFFNVFVPID